MMTDFSVIWYLDIGAGDGSSPGGYSGGYRPLPILTGELSEYIVNSQNYSQFYCPNSLYTSKGRDPGYALLVVPYKDVEDARRGTSTQGATLKIVYTRNNPDITEVPDQEMEFWFLRHRIVEVLPNKLRLNGDDLCVVELRDYRQGQNVFSKHTDNDDDNISNSGTLDVVTDDMIKKLWSYGTQFYRNKSSLDSSNAFIPEKGIGKQFYKHVTGNYRNFFFETLARTENIFFVDKDGSAVVQRLSHYDNVTQELLDSYVSHTALTETLIEDLEARVQFPGTIQPWFWESSDKTSLGNDLSTLDRSSLYRLRYTKKWNSFGLYDRQPIYPITYPSIEEGGSESKQQSIWGRVAERYVDEIQKQALIEPKKYVFHGNLAFNLRSHITELAYTNNPYGVFTYVTILPRHGQPFFELPNDRLVHIIKPDMCSFNGNQVYLEEGKNPWEWKGPNDLENDKFYQVGLAVKSLTNVEGYNLPDGNNRGGDGPFSKVFATTETFISEFSNLILKKRGTYIYSLPVKIEFARKRGTLVTKTVSGGGGGTVDIGYPYEKESLNFELRLMHPPNRPSVLNPSGGFSEKVICTKDFSIPSYLDAAGAAGEYRIIETVLSGIFSLNENVTEDNPVEFGFFVKFSLVAQAPDPYQRIYFGEATDVGYDQINTTDLGYILHYPEMLDRTEYLETLAYPPFTN